MSATKRRLADLQRFYALLAKLIDRQGGVRLLRDCDGRLEWPERGVYFFFEPGEARSDSGRGLRVVRVGTHALKAGSRTTLWNRLSQHRGSASSGRGNHRGSVFRLLVGAALMGRRPGWSVQSWGEGSSAPKPVRINERKLESEVSNLIGNMPFTWLPVLDEPGPTSARGDIERGSIALLSNWAREVLDAPTGEWLGLHCPREKVRESGLWNQNHVDERYDPSFLDLFERLLEKDGRESRSSAPRDTVAPSPLVPAPPARAPSGGNAARIIALLRETPNLDDDQISVKLGITPRQQVNQICRRLERTGVLARGRGTHGKIVNRLIGGGEGRLPVRPPEPVGPPVAPLTSRLVTSATGGSVLASTLLLIPCSGRKKRVTGRNASGPSILDQLSPEFALELSLARDEVRERVGVSPRLDVQREARRRSGRCRWVTGFA